MQSINYTPRSLSFKQRLALMVHAFQPKSAAKLWGAGVEPWLVSLNRMEDCALQSHPQFTDAILYKSDAIRYAVRRGDLTKQEGLVAFRQYLAKLVH